MNENQTLAIVVIAGGILLFVFKDAPTKIPEPAPEPMEQEYDQQIDQMNQKMQVLYNQINQQFPKIKPTKKQCTTIKQWNKINQPTYWCCCIKRIGIREVLI